MGSRLCRLPVVTLLCCPAASARAPACRTARWAALAETAETPIAQAPAIGPDGAPRNGRKVGKMVGRNRHQREKWRIFCFMWQ
jgi:hypothetical protein